MTTFWKIIMVASLGLNLLLFLIVGIYVGRETARKELEKGLRDLIDSNILKKSEHFKISKDDK